jgi:hypothetical protein
LEFKSRAEDDKSSILQSFQNQLVRVEFSDSSFVDGRLLVVRGRLIGFETRGQHLPKLLVLENRFGFSIVRGNVVKISLDG